MLSIITGIFACAFVYVIRASAPDSAEDEYDGYL